MDLRYMIFYTDPREGDSFFLFLIFILFFYFPTVVYKTECSIPTPCSRAPASSYGDRWTVEDRSGPCFDRVLRHSY